MRLLRRILGVGDDPEERETTFAQQNGVPTEEMAHQTTGDTRRAAAS